MRISDPSSDVCSSDLQHLAAPARHGGRPARPVRPESGIVPAQRHPAEPLAQRRQPLGEVVVGAVDAVALDEAEQQPPGVVVDPRSEEHTSELQSLMRTSYAVFCLKKKNHPSGAITTTDAAHTVHTS